MEYRPNNLEQRPIKKKKKKIGTEGVLDSEHARERVLRGSFIFWVRVNLEHLL